MLPNKNPDNGTDGDPGDGSNGHAKLSFKELQERRNAKKEQQDQARQVGGILTGLDPELVESALTADELGHPARFAIADPISLPRQQSAMLPILDQLIDAERVSIYNESVQAKHPLLGMKIRNTSKQALMQGPIAVYDDQQYLGDSRILDLQPGEERLISFAIDTGVEIKQFDKVYPSTEMTAKMDSGRLKVQYKLHQTRTYVINNRSPEARRLVIEQPVREGWKFAEARKVVQAGAGKDGKEPAWKPGDAEKPTERTRVLYRFGLDVKPGESVKYEVSEELPRLDPFESAKQADWTGFATTLGLDVWTDAKLAPEGRYNLEIADNQLKVTHKHRQETTYFLRNRADVERTVWLEHFVPSDRRLVGDVKPEGDDARRYRFKLVLPPGKTLTQAVTEEDVTARPEAMKSQKAPVDSQRLPKGVNADDIPTERFCSPLGFEVWQSQRALPDALVSARFRKGELHTTAKESTATTYHIHNLSGEERLFEIDHRVRLPWSLSGKDKPVEGFANTLRFALKTGQVQIVKREVIEERVTSRQESLASMTPERVKALIASATIGEDVKVNIRRGTTMLQTLSQTEIALKELQVRLKEVVDEQSRIKGNLDKLPPTSDLYKRLLDKFDKQETLLEGVQRQFVEKSSEGQRQRHELERFLEKLSVD